MDPLQKLLKMNKRGDQNKNQPITVLIIDDERPARKRITELLQEQEDFEIVGECSNGEEAIETIEKILPDMVFLDIQLQDMNGFEVLAKLKNISLPTVVFVTAYDKYALRAFNFHALDYLLKPFDDERFEETLQIASKDIRREKIEDLSEKISDLITRYGKSSDSHDSKRFPHQNRLVLKSAGKVTFIETRNIDWIAAEGYYVSIRASGKSHLMRESLKNLEKMLDPGTFLRIHRSTIININRIKELHSHFHGEFFVVLRDGKKFKLSRSYRANAEKLLGGNF